MDSKGLVIYMLCDTMRWQVNISLISFFGMEKEGNCYLEGRS